MTRLWGCRRCGVVTDRLDGYGWCRDCVSVEAYYRHREQQRVYYATDLDANRVRIERARAWRAARRAA